MGQAQNLAMGRDGPGQPGKIRDGMQDGTITIFLSKSGTGHAGMEFWQHVLGQNRGQKKKIEKKLKILKTKMFWQFFTFLTFFFDNQVVIVSRDIPGQKSLSRDFWSWPWTKGHQDKETFFVLRQRDSGTRKLFCPWTKGTMGRPVPDCPGMSRPLETLVCTVHPKQIYFLRNRGHLKFV